MPVRPILIRRLELQASMLSSNICQFCREVLIYKNKGVVFWTDSQTTLQYIKNESKRFHTYVANRIADVNEYMKDRINELRRKIGFIIDHRSYTHNF